MTTQGYTVRRDALVSRHTALRTGGPCCAYLVAHDARGLLAARKHCKEQGWSLQMLGAGTRIVGRDAGVSGALLRLGEGFCYAREEGGVFTVGASFPVPALLAYALGKGCGGLLHAAGVAGSFGASIALDDGWEDLVRSVTVVRRGRLAEIALGDARKMRNVCIVSATLALPVAMLGEDEAIRGVWSRGEGRSSGSWYAAPDGTSPRDVFANVALQQVRLRRVMIPKAAPEMLVNLGGGTAEDLRLLGRSTMDRVKRVRGVSLREAHKWIGSTSPKREEG